MSLNRKIIAHTIHAQGTTRSYARIFEALNDLEPAQRVFSYDSLIVGIPKVWKRGPVYLLQFAEGTLGVNPFVLDSRSGATRVDPLGRNEVLSDVSHALVLPSQREAVIEYVKRGAKAALMASTIEGILRTHFDDLRKLRLEFSPIIREDFAEEIDRFERIRTAELVVTQPNAGWTDHYTELSALLANSDGDNARLDVRAARGESLNKDSGIVQVIKEISQDATPYLKDARITGTRPEDVTETTVSLHNHVEHKRVTVETDQNGQADPQSLVSKMRRLLRGTAE